MNEHQHHLAHRDGIPHRHRTVTADGLAGVVVMFVSALVSAFLIMLIIREVVL